MAVLEFDANGKRYYENGTSKVVIYPKKLTEAGAVEYKPGYAFDGATEISENPGGADANDMYADNIKYGSLRSAETFGCTLGAYQYPPEFAELDGTKRLAGGVFLGQQVRRAFGMCYRTEVGNDVDPEAGYKIHIVYDCTASPSSKGYSTVNESPDAITFSWEISTTPVRVNKAGVKPLATITIDTTKLAPEFKTKIAALEEKLYGTSTDDPYLPLPDEIIEMFETTSGGTEQQ